VTTTIKVLLAAAIALTLRTAGAEAPFWPSWSTTALPATNSMAQSGANPDVILLVRGSSDPVRSLDGGATFPDRANGTLTYTAFGQTATRQISRQPF
jgi:hypothetical protein